MSNKDIEREAQLQALAEQGDGGDNPDIKAYRVIHHAVREAGIPEIPPGFAAQMESLARDPGEESRLEQWITSIALAAAGIAVTGLAAPVASRAFSALASRFPDAPWEMLLATGGVLFATWLADCILSVRNPLLD